MLNWIVWNETVFDIETVLTLNWIVLYRTVFTYNWLNCRSQYSNVQNKQQEQHLPVQQPQLADKM